MRAKRRRVDPRVLAVVRTDNTFERVTFRGAPAWQGQCLFCRKKLVVDEDGRPLTAVSLEHIVARSSGGTDELFNLALACPGCNHEKGRSHDRKGLSDARAGEVVEALLARRRARWREPS
ncbi:MAG: HNH endonuclease [Myxococcota bacterium]